jgi:DHA2 family multidrug resistance protein-like MFS transporter
MDSFGRKWPLLGVLSLSLFCLALDTTKIAVAVPTLGRVFGAGPAALKWMVESYLLVYATLLLLGGALSERFGARRMLLIGVALYGGGSCLAFGAGSLDALTACRAVMGAGGALMTPASLATLKHTFPERERARAIAVWTGSFGAGAAIGPVVSGWLLDRYAWGAIMLANLPPALLILVGTERWVPRNLPRRSAPLDVFGAGLAILATAALLYAVLEGPYLGLGNPFVALAGVAAVALYAVLVVWERRTPHPMLDPELFGRGRFVAALLVIVLAYLSFSGVSFVLSQYLQVARGHEPFEAGLLSAPLAVSLMLGNGFAPWMTRRLGERRALLWSLLAGSAGAALLVVASACQNDALLCVAEVLFGGGAGGVFVNATDLVIGSAPDARAGSAAAINETAFEFGGVLGIAILGTIQATGGISRGAPYAIGVAVAAFVAALGVARRGRA